MRIAMLANTQAVHTMRWATAYAKRGHDVHVLSIRKTRIPGVTVHRIGIGPAGSQAKWLTFLSYLLLLVVARWRLRGLRPDVVHAHFSLTHGVIAALAGWRPLVLTTWGSDAIWRRPGRPPVWFRLLNLLAIRRADAVTGTSAFLCHAARTYASDPSRVVEVPFGVDTARFHPGSNPDAVAGEPGIAFVKTLNPKYGAEHLIRAMPAVLEALPGARLTLAGRGPLHGALHALAAELGVAENVEFTGFVPHEAVPDVLRASQIFVNPSVVPESFGVAVLEASACALPVVATAVGGVPEVCRDEETGLIVPPGDSAALASAIIRLGRDPALRVRLGSAGRKFVLSRFEWDRTVEQMLEVLETARRRRDAPPELVTPNVDIRSAGRWDLPPN